MSCEGSWDLVNRKGKESKGSLVPFGSGERKSGIRIDSPLIIHVESLTLPDWTSRAEGKERSEGIEYWGILNKLEKLTR